MDAWCCVHLQPVQDWLEANHYELLSGWLSDRGSVARSVYCTPNLTPAQLLDKLAPEHRVGLDCFDNGSTNYTGPVIACGADMLEIGLSPNKQW